MHVGEVMRRRGGLATRAQLVQATSRRDVDAALAAGAVVRLAQGRLALPSLDEAPRLAHRLTGILCLTSAAQYHGWEVLRVPSRPHVAVRRQRHLTAEQKRQAVIHYLDVHPDDLDGGIATGAELTLTQCLRHLPDDEALAIADSALRHDVPPSTLRRIASSVRGPGAARVRRVCGEARAEAANPFESGLRAVALSVPGLAVEVRRPVS